MGCVGERQEGRAVRAQRRAAGRAAPSPRHANPAPLNPAPATTPRPRPTPNPRPPTLGPQAIAQWHSDYHLARAWAERKGGGSLAKLQAVAEASAAWDAARRAYQVETQRAAQRLERERLHRKKGKDEIADRAAADREASLAIAAAAAEAAAAEDPRTGCDAEEIAIVGWLKHQPELYEARKMDELRLRLLRRLGVRLRRQKGGPAPEELHPGLRFAEPARGRLATPARGGEGGESGESGAGGSEGAAAPAPPPRQVVLRVSAATRRGAYLAKELSAALRAGTDVWALLEPDSGPRGTGAVRAAARAEAVALGVDTPRPGSRDEQRFMLMLSQLQAWYTRYGRGAPVPHGVFDRPRLAEWVAELRAAAAGRAAIKAARAAARPQPGGAHGAAAGEEGAARDEEGEDDEAAAAEAVGSAQGAGELGPLKRWQAVELEAAGFREKPEVRGQEGAGFKGAKGWSGAIMPTPDPKPQPPASSPDPGAARMAHGVPRAAPRQGARRRRRRRDAGRGRADGQRRQQRRRRGRKFRSCSAGRAGGGGSARRAGGAGRARRGARVARRAARRVRRGAACARGRAPAGAPIGPQVGGRRGRAAVTAAVWRQRG
jgi:hypothetical protein